MQRRLGMTIFTGSADAPRATAIAATSPIAQPVILSFISKSSRLQLRHAASGLVRGGGDYRHRQPAPQLLRVRGKPPSTAERKIGIVGCTDEGFRDASSW